jgi:hypothetical protein
MTLLLLGLLLQVEPRDRCVLLSAEVQKSPPRIEIRWTPDPKATSYTVYRKYPGDAGWVESGPPLDGKETKFEDATIQVGVAYEYKVLKAGQAGDKSFKGTGYLLAGIEVPLRDQRGTVVLVVDSSHAADLADPLRRLERDLVGDGWIVRRIDVAPAASPPEVKSKIKAIYEADRSGVRSVFLFGHVPVPYSGDLNPDGHGDHRGAWPADAYYGDMTGEWTDEQVDDAKASRPETRNVKGDGKFDPSRLPSPVDLQVGRVDLSQMPAFGKSETELLRRYLDKDHDYRHRRMEVERRGLVCDKFGDFRGEAFVSSGWRNFAPLVGDGAVRAADWFSTLGAEGYLVAQGSGAGGYQSCAGVGTTADFAAKPSKAVFTVLFGSYFGDWDTRDNFLRAPLASESYGLVSVWAGRPHWYLHSMALGETVGYCARLTQNNRGTYQPTGGFAGGVHVALMGDPTLRLHVVAPPSALRLADGKLSWTASPEANATYHVYAAPDGNGPFTRLTEAPVRETNFAPPPGKGSVFMIRAVKLESGASGTYVNASQGLFAP